jgi:hypothetical protein
LNGPCQMHFDVDADGRRQLGHLQKDCRTFQALRRATENTQAESISRGFAQGLRSEILYLCHHHPQSPVKTIINYKLQVLPTLVVTSPKQREH